MLLYRIIFMVFITLCSLHRVQAQKSIADSSISFVISSFGYQGCFTGMDFGKRFGYTNLIGLEMGYKFKFNLYMTTGAYFLVGDRVKEKNMLNNLTSTVYSKDANGNLIATRQWIDKNGSTYYPTFQERGYTIPFRIGYIINKLKLHKKQNPNSGFFVETGTQFIEHKIYIEVPRETPYLDKTNVKGYDRLCNGFGILGAVGFKFFSNKRFLNFMLSYDVAMNFTQSRRSIDYDTGKYDNTLRKDFYHGFRFLWMIPIYKVAPEKYYY